MNIVYAMYAMSDYTRANFLIVITLGMAFGLVVVFAFLSAMFYREQVKKDLWQRVCRPIQIRWRPSLWKYSSYYYSTQFRVVYSDPAGFVHEGCCLVYRPPMENPFWGSFRVVWLADTITGRLPSPEVWVNDEIIRPKLKARDESAEANRLLENPDKTSE